MDNLSNKVKVVYAALDMIGAHGKENKVNVYTILDFISEHEELQEHSLLKEMPEFDFVNIIMEMNIKSVVACITALAKKDLVIKTEADNYMIDGIKRSLKSYYIKK